MIKNSFLFCGILFVLVACSRPGPQHIGKQYLGAKYANDPLGEEIAPDSDPLIRFDAFDCTTFVETALANGDKELLTKIRYKNGEVGFLTRNHFIESDWIQNNNDIVKNVSNQYTPKTAIRTGIVDKQHWFKRVHNLDIQTPPVTVDLEYIPYANISKINNQKPLIVLFIIDNPNFVDTIGSDLIVAHMGFLLPNGILRHASSKQGRVVDVDFYEYIDNRAKNKTDLGITLLEIK